MHSSIKMHFCTVGWFFWNLIYENLVSIPFFNSKFLKLIRILKLTALLLFSHSPCSSAHGIPPTRILEWVAISFSRGSSQPRNQARISCIGRQILYHWATLEALLIHTECFNLDYILMVTNCPKTSVLFSCILFSSCILLTILWDDLNQLFLSGV